MIDLYFKKLSKDAVIPDQKRSSDAGYDLYSTIDTVVYPGNRVFIPTDIAVQGKINEETLSHLFKVYFRIDGCSGNAKNLGLQPIGGIIDKEYIGNIGVTLINISPDPVQIKKGKKIAQLVPHAIPIVDSVTVLKDNEEFEATDRGTTGFGYSGMAN